MYPLTATRKKQNGAALVVGLILLVVVTVLAVSGMNTATTELAMARNHQTYENAFQAAETGLEQALSQITFDASRTIANPLVLPTLTVNTHGSAYDSVTTSIAFQESTTSVPDKAFTLGSGIAAHHFVATATAATRRSGGATDRDANAVHTQAFYKVGPAPATLSPIGVVP